MTAYDPDVRIHDADGPDALRYAQEAKERDEAVLNVNGIELRDSKGEPVADARNDPGFERGEVSIENIRDAEPSRTEAQRAMADLDTLLADYVHFPNVEMRWACAIWAAHTFVYDHEDAYGYHLHGIVPYLWVKSAGRSSGKTTLADLLVQTTASGRRTDSMSAPALFRRLAQGTFTPFFDEADNSLPTTSNAEDGGRLLLSVLNSGYKRGGTVERTNRLTHQPEEFPTFGPKAIIGIKVKVADTLSSRCIHIMLERAKKGEVKKRWRERDVAPRAKDVKERLDQHLPLLDLHIPDDAEEWLSFIENREYDIWEVMLTTADAIGGPWPERCVEAARLLTKAEMSMSVGEQLLHDILIIFHAAGDPEFLSTREILGRTAEDSTDDKGLLGMDTSPWAQFRRSGSLSATQMAHLLRPFGVEPGRTSLSGGGKTPKGYWRKNVEEAWKRWGPVTS